MTSKLKKSYQVQNQTWPAICSLYKIVHKFQMICICGTQVIDTASHWHVLSRYPQLLHISFVLCNFIG